MVDKVTICGLYFLQMMVNILKQLRSRTHKSRKKRGRPPITSPLLTGDDELDRKCLKILLVLNDTNPTEIARELGIRPQSVCGVINRQDNSRRILEYLQNLPVQLTGEMREP